MLDPEDWDGFRANAHHMLDDMIDYLQQIRQRPVWQQAPADVRQHFQEPLPQEASSLEALHQTFMHDILPYSVGNTHPGFMGWVHGGGTPVGMLAEMLAAGLNANLGGRNQIPLEVERQIVLWMCELFHFPTQSAGVLTTGTSAATIIALSTARHTYLSKHGQQQADRLCVYASSESHGCIWRALRIMGFAKDCLRLIPCLDNHSINIALLEQRIIDDQKNGMVAWLIVGNAGTVNTGAIDDLQSLASLAASVGAWLHIDGALGALAMLSPQLAVAFKGIEQADSIAMDFHKWGQVPYDAGFVLMRDGEAHRQNFDASDAYLQRDEQGLAANSPWPCDQGIDLSRGFRALKVWFTLKSFGTKQMAAMMEHSCALAQELAELIQVNPVLVLMADVPLNIVCFRYCGDKSLSDSAYDTINRAMVVHIQCSGLAAPSLTVLHGRAVIRVAIVNHRSQSSDIGKLLASTMDAVEACGS